MPGTSVISNRIDSHRNECKKSGSQQNGEITVANKHLNGKSSNVKENKDLNCCIINKYIGARRRTLNGNELRDLLTNPPKYYNLDDANLDIFESNQKTWDQTYSFPRLYIIGDANENQLDPFVLQPSLFHKNNVPPTLYFNTRLSEKSRPPVGLPKSLQRLFRWKISTITPNSIRNCVSFMKFETIRPSNTTDKLYLGSWCKHMPTSDFTQLEEWRKVNHYPGSFHMGRKDKLWLRLRLANQKHKFESFHPQTFVLPRDYNELNEFWRNSPSNLFIIKPPASARGNGIRVINHISQIPESVLKLPQSSDGTPIKKSTMIVQQYISNPCLLENGHKFDLRIYVLVTSVDPLRIYICEEGLVRFASSKYTSQESGIIDQYMHLTNYFVNKNNQEYQVNNDCESLHGNKWTLRRFWRYLGEHYKHVSAQKLWEEIVDIIIKTVVCCEGPMARLSNQNCKNDYTSYELFGFDIILDQNFKPWILEVNITPSLKSESHLDTSVKFRVIKDMFNIVGYNLPPLSIAEDGQLNNFADCRLFFDRRLYTENLTRQDKMKHLKYQKLFRSENEVLKSTTEDEVVADDRRNHHASGLLTQSSSQVSSLSDSGERKQDDENSRQQRAASGNDQSSDDDSAYTKLTCSDSILSDLTQSDIRVLMLSEDELSRCGQFKRVFPSATSSKYLKYFDRPRYYNLLLDAWEQKYKDNRMEGINYLSSLANFLN